MTVDGRLGSRILRKISQDMARPYKRIGGRRDQPQQIGPHSKRRLIGWLDSDPPRLIMTHFSAGQLANQGNSEALIYSVSAYVVHLMARPFSMGVLQLT